MASSMLRGLNSAVVGRSLFTRSSPITAGLWTAPKVVLSAHAQRTFSSQLPLRDYNGDYNRGGGGGSGGRFSNRGEFSNNRGGFNNNRGGFSNNRGPPRDGPRRGRDAEREPSSVIFVGNCPFAVTEGDLEPIFQEFQGFQSANAPTGKGIGFIHFDTVENATAALKELNQSSLRLGDRQIFLSYGDSPQSRERKTSTSIRRRDRPSSFIPQKSRSLYLGNLPYTTTTEDVQALVESLVSDAPFKIRLGLRPQIGRSNFAHVDFDDVESAEKAVNLAQEQQLKLEGRLVLFDFAAEDPVNPPSSRVYYRGFMGGEQEFAEIFEKHDITPKEIVPLPNRETRQPSGSGFVQLGSIEEADKVIAKLNGQTLSEGFPLQLSYARPRRENSSWD